MQLITENKVVPKLRFKEFKEHWKENKLGNIATFYNSKRVALTASDREKGEYPYYGASGIIDYVKDFIFEGEYILLGEDGANIVMRNSRLVFLAKGKFWLNNHAHIFQSKDSNAFLCEALERINYKKYNTGTAQPKLNSDVVKKIKLNLPSLPEQQKIASFLSAVDKKLHQLTKKKELLEEYKKGIMQKIFSQELRFKDEFGNDYPDWKLEKIKNITSIKAGGTPSTLKVEYWNGEIPWMNSGELNLKRIYDVKNRITELGLKNSSTRLIPKECILIGLAGQGKTRGTAAVNYISLCTNQSIAAIYPNESLNTEFIYQNIDSRYEELRRLSAGDGGRGGLNLSIIGGFGVPLPSLPEQQKIANFLSSIDNKIDLVSNQLDNTKVFKKGLLQQMFV